MESLRLKKASQVTKTNHQPISSIPAKPRPSATVWYCLSCQLWTTKAASWSFLLALTLQQKGLEGSSLALVPMACRGKSHVLSLWYVPALLNNPALFSPYKQLHRRAASSHRAGSAALLSVVLFTAPKTLWCRWGWGWVLHWGFASWTPVAALSQVLAFDGFAAHGTAVQYLLHQHRIDNPLGAAAQRQGVARRGPASGCCTLRVTAHPQGTDLRSFCSMRFVCPYECHMGCALPLLVWWSANTHLQRSAHLSLLKAMIRDEFGALQPVYTSTQGPGIEIGVRSPPVLCLFVGFKQHMEEGGWMVPVPLSHCKSGWGPPALEKNCNASTSSKTGNL